MNTIRREITPQIKVLDAAAGLVEYVASDATVDCYNEVVDPAGANFDRFQKNAPFVDSHNYESIDSLLGSVVDFRVKNRQVVETVKWAKEVALNRLAQLGFAMTEAGFLKAVSIGFLPQKVVSKFDSDPTDYNDAVEKLDLGDVAPRCIYTRWLQTELSACVVGANPSAVARAYQDGIIEDSDLLRFPQFRSAVASGQGGSRRSYSFPSATTPNPDPAMRKSFLDSFTAATSKIAGPSVAQAADALEVARRGQSESDLYRASALMRLAMARQRRITVHERASEILSDGLVADYLEALPRYLCGASGRNFDLVKKSLNIGSGTLGATLLPIGVAQPIWDMILLNGAFKHMGIVELDTLQSKVAQATANPTAVWITPSNNGTTIPADSALTGSNLTPEANTLGIILPVSRELMQDQKANLSYYLLTRFSEALAGGIDYAALQGNGVNDTTNGSQTGIFVDNTIAAVSAAQGNTSIAQLARADFLTAIAAVAPAALQRECKWFISPSFIAPLMTLTDSAGRSYLLKTPAETGDDTWRLVGFEVVWSAQAPANNAPGSKFAAFGHGPAYMVAIRTQLEIMLADSASGFASNQQSFRALSKAFCQTRLATGLATLAFAAA